MKTPRFLKSSVFALSAGAAFLAASSDAEACSPPLPVVVEVSGHLPDGILLGQLTCGDCTTDDLIFEDHWGNPLSGTFVELAEIAPENAFGWVPDKPLEYTEPDEANVIRFDGVGFEPTTFWTASADDDTPVSHISEVSESRAAAGGAATCHSFSSSLTGGYCFLPQYSASTRVSAAIRIDIEGGESMEHLFRVEWWGGGSDDVIEEFPWRTANVNHVFEGEPAAVCYALYATPATGGEESLVGEDCFDTRDIEFGIVDEGYGERSEVLDSCIEPGDELKPEWCQWYASAIEAGSCDGFPTDACEAARVTCTEEDLTPNEEESPDGVGVVDAGDGTGSNDPDPGLEQNDDDTMEQDGTQNNSGCSFGGRGGNSPVSIAVLLSGLLGWAARRRRVHSLFQG